MFIIIVLLIFSTLLVYWTGGTKYVFLHVTYLPIILAGFLYRVRGGLVTGLVAGVLLGPFMPLDTYGDVEQSIFSMFYRTFFFMSIGAVVGRLSHSIYKKYQQLKEALDNISIIYGKTLRSYAKMVEMRDERTLMHCERVAYNSWLLGKEMGMDNESLKSLYWAGLLHDLGKIRISETILLKPGKLTEEEFEIIKEHCLIGYEFLINLSEDLEMIAIGVRSHHERWDGHGYPDGSKELDIPLFGRIIAIVDVFEALTNKRPYKEAQSPEEAIQYMLENQETDFDPDILELFINLYKDQKVWVIYYPYHVDVSFSKETFTNSLPL